MLSINQPSLLSLSYSKKWEQYKILISSQKSIGLSSLNGAAFISDLDERKEIYIWAMAQKVKFNIKENKSIKNLIQLKIIKIQRTLWKYSYASWKEKHLLKCLFKWCPHCKEIAEIGSKMIL